MAQKDNSFQVIIAGGGLVGLSLAAALGRQGVKTAVLEAAEPQADWPQESIDLRVFAITRTSQQLFEDVGAWPAMRSRAAAYTDMRVWDAAGNGDIHFDCAEIGEPDLGFILESRVIEKALLDVIKTLPAITWFCPARVQEFTILDDVQQVSLEDGGVLTTKLLVGADGKRSRVRDYARIHAIASDYGQKALVCVVSTQRHHQATAWQRFMPTGPLAFLPLFDGRCSIVWSADSERAQQLLQLDDEHFCMELAEAFDHRLGDITTVGQRLLFPLHRQYAQHYVAPRIALAGDAAHVIHPLAGQGVNLGLKDVIELNKVIGSALAEKKDHGSLSVLRRYERARKGDNMAMMAAMDGFKHLFGSSLPPLRWVRNLGLNVVDAAGPLKNQIMRTAMGL